MSESPHEPSTDPVKHVVDEVTPEITAFMGTVAGTPSFQLGELVGDEIKLWRFKRSLRHAQRAKEMLDAAGLKPHQVPFRTLVPLVETASLEDDEELTERWAALLANAASGQEHVPPSFPNVLRELEPVQARLLDSLYHATMSMAPELRRTAGITAKAPGEAAPDIDYHADNLRRLRLADTPSHSIDPDLLLLTDFGTKFVRACRPPGAVDPPIRYHTQQQLQEVVQANKKRRAEEAEASRAPEADESGDK